MRVVLVILLALAGLAFILLYLRSGHTGREFAWTIRPDITAALLDAGYGAGCVLIAASLRRRPWAEVRVGIGIVLVFSAMILVTTLLHLERFHFGAASGGIALRRLGLSGRARVRAPVGTWLFVREQRLAGAAAAGRLGPARLVQGGHRRAGRAHGRLRGGVVRGPLGVRPPPGRGR